MKESIIKLLNSFLESNSLVETNLDINFYQDLIHKIKYEKDYYNKFIIELDDNKLKFLLNDITDETQKNNILASIIYLRNLIEINQKENVVIPFSDSQRDTIDKLLETINQKIEKYQSQNSNNINILLEDVKSLISKLDNNKLLNKQDYDIIEQIIYHDNTNDSDALFDKAMTYFNTYNLDILNSLNKEIPEEPKKEIKVEDVSSTQINTIEVPKDFDIFVPNEINSEDQIDTKSNNIKVSSKISVKEILDELDINENELSPYFNNLITNTNENTIKNNYKYIFNNLKNYLTLDNPYSVLSLICCSDSSTLKENLAYLNEIDLSIESIKDLFNRAPQIFFTSNKNSFKNNFELATKIGIKIDDLIRTNITFFYNSYEYNQNKVNILEEKGINIYKLFREKPQLFAVGLEKILKNINTIHNYSIDLSTEDYDNISVLGNNNLIKMLDLFIESGFSEYISSGDNLKNIRSLIVKRIFYALKNNLDIWHENVESSRINSEYEEIINKERKSLTEEDINFLLADYDELDILESGKRVVLFTDTVEAQIKRKYEFIFNNQIISRLKTYSIFSVLARHNIDTKDAMFYALTYNSNLSNIDYLTIKKEIVGK